MGKSSQIATILKCHFCGQTREQPSRAETLNIAALAGCDGLAPRTFAGVTGHSTIAVEGQVGPAFPTLEHSAAKVSNEPILLKNNVL